MESFPITVCGQRNLLYSGFLWIAAATISCRLLEGLVLQGFLHPPSPAAEVGDMENLRKLEIFQNLFTPGKTFPAASSQMDGISRIVTKRQFFAKQIVKERQICDKHSTNSRMEVGLEVLKHTLV